MAYDRKDKNKRPSGFTELVEYIKEGIQKKGAGKYVKYAGMALVAMIVIIVVVNLTGKKGGTGETSSGDVVIVPSDSLTFDSEGITNPLQKDAYPEINRVIEQYYKARLDRDVDTINKIVDAENDATVEELEKLTVGIESIENITCYTKKGLLENTFIVFVVHEVKIVGTTLMAPTSMRLYVTKDTDGNVIILEKKYDDEVSAYIKEISQDSDVVALLADVNERLIQAKSEDPKLKEILEFMAKSAGTKQEETTEIEESERESSNESSTEETIKPEETTKIETTASETTKASTTAAN